MLRQEVTQCDRFMHVINTFAIRRADAKKLIVFDISKENLLNGSHVQASRFSIKKQHKNSRHTGCKGKDNRFGSEYL